MPTATATATRELGFVRASPVEPLEPMPAAAPRQTSWGEPFGVLLVEDNDDEIIAIKRTLRSGGLTDRPHIARDGRAALDTLLGSGLEPDALSPEGVPDLILLDLELPKISGFSVLRRIKEHPRVADVPVIVLTGADDDGVAKACMNLGANMYIVKPISYVHVMNVIVAVQKHWLATENFRAFDLSWSTRRVA